MSESPSTSRGLNEEQEDALNALGWFVMVWSALEGFLEVAIAFQLGLMPLESSIVTAGLQFKARITMLKGLLNRDSVTNEAAIKIVNQIMNKGVRNDLLHGVVGLQEHGLIFTRRKSDGRFSSVQKEYSREELMAVTVEIAELIESLRRALDIPSEHYTAFHHLAHSAANKPSH